MSNLWYSVLNLLFSFLSAFALYDMMFIVWCVLYLSHCWSIFQAYPYVHTLLADNGIIVLLGPLLVGPPVHQVSQIILASYFPYILHVNQRLTHQLTFPRHAPSLKDRWSITLALALGSLSALHLFFIGYHFWITDNLFDNLSEFAMMQWHGEGLTNATIQT